MRLRCMKKKRKSYNDNYKLRVVFFRKKLGLLTLEEFCLSRTMPKNAARLLARGTLYRGRPVREILTPVNMGN